MEPTTPKLTRSEQARVNGSRSSGPVTEQGKQRSSLNAMKHGVYTDLVLLPGESSEEFMKLLHAYEHQFRPTDQIEMDLIQDLADARWRINRMKRQEALEWSQAAFEAAHDPALDEAPYEVLHEYGHRNRCQMKGNPIEVCRRAEARYRRDYDRALKTLQQHRKQKQQEKCENEPKPVPENVKNEPNETPVQPPQPPQKPQEPPQAAHWDPESGVPDDVTPLMLYLTRSLRS